MNRRARGVDNSIAFGAHFVLKHVAGKNSTVPCFHLNAVAIEGMKFAPRERFELLEKRGQLATEPSDVKYYSFPVTYCARPQSRAQ